MGTRVTPGQMKAMGDAILAFHDAINEWDPENELDDQEIEDMQQSNEFANLYHEVDDLHNTLDGLREIH